MTETKDLHAAEPPWVLQDLVSNDDLLLLPEALYADNRKDVVLKSLRGRKMHTLQGLMDEFGAALQLFEGFGENWPALRECLAYLDEWMPAKEYILVLTRPSEILIEDPEDRPVLLQALEGAGKWWSTPITDNGRFNRPSIPFHVILQVQADERDAIGSRFGSLPMLDRSSPGSK